MAVNGNDLAGNQPQPLRRHMLQPGFKQKLHPQTNAQQRRSGRRAGTDGPKEALLLQAAHRIGKRADAGQDQPVGVLDRLRRSADGIRYAQPVERVADRVEIAHRIVNDRQHKIPFVESTPPVRSREAALSARAKDLNSASALWWSFSPYRSAICSVTPAE